MREITENYKDVRRKIGRGRVGGKVERGGGAGDGDDIDGEGNRSG